MLARYLADTQRLLQNPQAPTSLYSEPDLTRWINIARGQMAGETGCIRRIGTINTVIDQQAYDFSGISLGVAATTGVEGVVSISRINYAVASGQKWIAPRPWPWFDFYVLNNPVPQGSEPTDWAQYAQGAAPGATGVAAGGSFYINRPNSTYQLNCDCACYPIQLVDDDTVEAIPYLWTDAVPYFAAYYALLSAQNNARLNDAKQYYNLYNEFIGRARMAANPSVNRWMYSGAADPVQPGKLGRSGGGNNAAQ